MAKKGEGFMYGYNCQAAVDGDHQIIVAADLHDVSNDYGALKPMVDQISEDCEAAAEAILVDSGYRSAKNIAAIEEADSTPSHWQRAKRLQGKTYAIALRFRRKTMNLSTNVPQAIN